MTNTRPEPFFIADSVALDFLNSVAVPKADEYDWLESGEDVLDWLVQSGLVKEEQVKALRNPKVRSSLDAVSKKIRAFREEFRFFVISTSEAGQVQDDHPFINKLNRLMSEGEQKMRLSSAAGGGYALKVVYEINKAGDLLPRLAAACAELIAEANFAYIRKCEGPGCTLYFRDVSKNHKRRWCSMEVCGNRAKAAAFRRRT